MNPNPLVVWNLETGCGVRVRPGFDHRFHSEVCEQDSTHTGDALQKEALDYQAERLPSKARCPHGIAETHLETE